MYNMLACVFNVDIYLNKGIFMDGNGDQCQHIIYVNIYLCAYTYLLYNVRIDDLSQHNHR